ncbi:hypothetical protein RAS1_28000 [Phycisphaerae bacterium RAS1]|nr:hypothetical protein RAS1_28000 [Phycisphaerae bacterium RAS1]
MGERHLIAAVALLLLAAADGCSRNQPPAAATSQPAAPSEGLTLLTPGWDAWTRDEAVARLPDADAAVSAALRLVRLAEIEPLCAPADITDRTVRQLRVASLADAGWALGFAPGAATSAAPAALRLAAPVLIATDGTVHRIAEGAEEETLLLRVSDRPDSYPHLLVSARRVWLAGPPPQAALQLRPAVHVRLGIVEETGLGRIVVLCRSPAGPTVAARYAWDVYEQVFVGPAAERLPDPPGGRFELDLDASPLLQPVGGEIPEPTSQPAAEFFPRGVPIFFVYRSPDWR